MTRKAKVDGVRVPSSYERRARTVIPIRLAQVSRVHPFDSRRARSCSISAGRGMGASFPRSATLKHRVMGFAQGFHVVTLTRLAKRHVHMLRARRDTEFDFIVTTEFC